MSNCRRMCHTDTDAPKYYGYKRDGIYQFFDAILITGYNQKFILQFARTERIVTVNYETPHGYTVGQLLEFSGSTYPAFNQNYRVIETPTTNSLKIYIKDDSFASYPEASSESIQSKVAPFGWEKVFESSTQRSYRSRSEKSSKIVFTIKQPTYNATKFITEGAIAYEVDLSKDIDPLTGSPIDSCFASEKASFGHTTRYWPVSANTDDLFTNLNYSTPSETIAPWSCVGDESMVYFMHCPYEPYNDFNNKNNSNRQVDVYTGSYRYPKCFAFGDIDVEDEQEYITGSSFYFKFFYARVGSAEGSLTDATYNPFIRTGNSSWYDATFSAYDPAGVSASIRMSTITAVAENNYHFNGSSYLWNAYPQRVSGGLTYYDYCAYADGPSAGRNSVSCFYRGVFKYVKYCDTNLSNIGNPGFLHNKIHATNLPYKFLYTVNNSTNSWADLNYQGYYVFELD